MEYVLPAALALLITWREWCFRQERREWTEERRALLGRIGVTVIQPQPNGRPANYGTDEYEYQVECERRGEDRL